MYVCLGVPMCMCVILSKEREKCFGSKCKQRREKGKICVISTHVYYVPGAEPSPEVKMVNRRALALDLVQLTAYGITASSFLLSTGAPAQ